MLWSHSRPSHGLPQPYEGVLGGPCLQTGFLLSATLPTRSSITPALTSNPLFFTRMRTLQFLALLDDYKAKHIDVHGIIGRVRTLCRDHHDLLLDFKMFLVQPHGHQSHHTKPFA